MTVDEVLDYFGGKSKKKSRISSTAAALDISYQAVQQWVDNDEVPEGRKWQIQALSGGQLRADKTAAA